LQGDRPGRITLSLMPDDPSPSFMLIAVDPGVNGAIVWKHKGVVTAVRMPPTDFAVVELLADLSAKSPLIEIFIELPPLYTGRNIPGSAIAKLYGNYALIYGAAVALKFKVRPVRPPEWQKAHPVGKKGDLTTTAWKNKLKARACELFPDLPVTLCTSDALLLLDAAMRGAVN